MFNKQTTELNDFTPSWLRLPPVPRDRPQTLHWPHNNNNNNGTSSTGGGGNNNSNNSNNSNGNNKNNNNVDTFQPRKSESVLQKDDFPRLVETSGGSHRGGVTSAWSAPLASSTSFESPSPSPTSSLSTASVVGQLGSRAGNRMYKAMLPRNLTRRVLAPRPTNVQNQQLQEQQPQLVQPPPMASQHFRQQQQQQQQQLHYVQQPQQKQHLLRQPQQQQQQQQIQPLRQRITVDGFEINANRANGRDSCNIPLFADTVTTPTPMAGAPMSPHGGIVTTTTTAATTTAAAVSPGVSVTMRTTAPIAISNACQPERDVYNQNLLASASPCCDEAEERLLLAMGWRRDEVAGEGPLTPEEITEAAHWCHLGPNPFSANLYGKQQQHPQQHKHLTNAAFQPTLSLHHCADGTDKNNSISTMLLHKQGRTITSLTGSRGEQLMHAARMGLDLKKALLATMGVRADSDSDLEDIEDSDDDG